MEKMIVGAAALNQTPLDWAGNRDRILAAVVDARRQGVALLCLPELCVTGYGCEDLFLASWVSERALAVVQSELAPATEGLAVSVGLPVRVAEGLANGAALLVDGRLAGIACKQFLANDGIHYEPRWFIPWQAGDVRILETAAGPVPVGDLIFSCGGTRIGFEICEDAWVPQRPGARLKARGAHFILNPSASHFALGKHPHRARLVLEGSARFAATYLYANLLGNEAGRAIYDGSTLVAAEGRALASGSRFSFHDHVLTTAAVSVNASKHAETQKDEATVVSVPFSLPRQMAAAGRQRSATRVGPSKDSAVSSQRDVEVRCWEEELGHALVLAMWDYLRKSHSRGFVVSLSGGADSAACALVVALMVRRALAALGDDGARARLPYLTLPLLCGAVREGASFDDPAARPWIRALLLTVYQATATSSAESQQAARRLAEALGAAHHELDLEPIVGAYRERLEATLGRSLGWDTDDLALQNIQARVRAPSAWLFANLHGMLLCATGNRSEGAVGYATMDGDTAGGIAPIGGLAKITVQRWLRWLEMGGTGCLGPLPALAATNVRAPTAELRPVLHEGDAPQTDEGDLMPYEVLARLEEEAVLRRQAPRKAFEAVRAAFPQYEEVTLRNWTVRFFERWTQSQWKRERLAPAFHLDAYSIDAKTWCRFPILSAAFQDDVALLRSER